MVSVLLVSIHFAVVTVLSNCLILYLEAETKAKKYCSSMKVVKAFMKDESVFLL